MPQATNTPETTITATGPLPLESRHRPSGLNSRFDGGEAKFSDYVANRREMLIKAHFGKSRSLESVVEGNAPFELLPARDCQAGRTRPYSRGVLLIHGLTDSPYFMRHLASFFQQCGLRVMAILLPGHGTQPGDLLEVRWQEWARAVAYGVDQLAEEADEVFLAGYSAGATLAARHSLLDGRVRGLFLFSPALRVSSRAACANLHKLYSWLAPSAKWVGIKPDADIYKYESFPKNAAFQMHCLTQELRAQLLGREVNIPVFAAASADDATVDSAATVEFMARAHHQHSRLVYYTSAMQCPPGIAPGKVELVSSVLPGQGITSFAHTSIVVPPEDAHYGRRGDYANCLHYYPDDMEKYAVCASGSLPVLQGEVTEKNLRAGIVRRLMYNPHFSALLTSMRQFIGDLP